jgi:hypothetical protein
LPGRDECVEGLVWRLANPDDHVCVPQITREQAAQDNSVASSRLASRHSERFPPEKRTALPLPPARVGCHVFRDGQWVETRCATEEETKRLPPPTPALSIRNGLRLVQIGGRTIIYRAPIRFGEIDIEIESNPALGRVTDVVPAGVCPSATAERYLHSFSIQLNTNTFNTSYGGTGWVQFVLQTAGSDPVRREAFLEKDWLCVWKIDVDVANATGNANGYENICTSVAPAKNFLGSSGSGGLAVVAGLTHTAEDGTKLLTTWAQLPWGSSYGAAVTTTDTITGTFRGLAGDTKQYSLGLGNANWVQVTGDIYGTGCGSRAVFSGTRIFQRLYASSCTTFPYSCSAPLTQLSLRNFAAPTTDPGVTGESNNLRPVTGSQSIFNCIYSTTCERTGHFQSTLLSFGLEHVLGK